MRHVYIHSKHLGDMPAGFTVLGASDGLTWVMFSEVYLLLSYIKNRKTIHRTAITNIHKSKIIFG